MDSDLSFSRLDKIIDVTLDEFIVNYLRLNLLNKIVCSKIDYCKGLIDPAKEAQCKAEKEFKKRLDAGLIATTVIGGLVLHYYLRTDK